MVAKGCGEAEKVFFFLSMTISAKVDTVAGRRIKRKQSSPES
jgi:hypothetical protein